MVFGLDKTKRNILEKIWFGSPIHLDPFSSKKIYTFVFFFWFFMVWFGFAVKVVCTHLGATDAEVGN